MEETPPTRTPPHQGRTEDDIIEEHMELWWSRDPVKSLVCYTVAVLLIIICGIGGIVLLSTTTSRSGEWRLAVGSTLCLLALLVLLKQLLSSAIQDMHCLHSRERIDMLKSGGLSDTVVLLISAFVILICGVVLYILSFSREQSGPTTILITMHSVGITLIVCGAFIFLGLLIYALVIFYKSWATTRNFHFRSINVFSVSGQLSGSRNATSSMANLI
ncbi:transmembrane protein 125 [Spea bombifrons]|uniref:transmembrane protein 125 n=1 Tax=Spea bombifrons TaxID=233779 RepID=UPI0023494311|nr:transmembrane protein 125 [Spea bombifrons]